MLDSMTDELRYCLALNQLHVGTGSVAAWLAKAGSLANLFKADADAAALASYGASEKIIEGFQNLPWAQVDREIAWAEAQTNQHILSIYDPRYPPLLKQIGSPPLILYIKGSLAALTEPQLAIVGSRNPTSTGSETAFEFARCLAQAGLIVTSGLALGIDAASHRGALTAGKTIAVVGTGVDLIYPARHKALAHEIIAQGGAIVSEFPLGTRALPVHFPRRNRIISGLSLGTLVVEAALQSGSLITAKYALEQNREVFAIPGSIHSPLARGCHALLREGAKLVETAQDIIEEIGTLARVAQHPSPPLPVLPLAPPYQALLNHIDYTPTPMDMLVQRSGIKVADIASMLLILELEGHVSASATGYSRR